jgi:hypothetical protein
VFFLFVGVLDGVLVLGEVLGFLVLGVVFEGLVVLGLRSLGVVEVLGFELVSVLLGRAVLLALVLSASRGVAEGLVVLWVRALFVFLLTTNPCLFLTS